MENRKVVMMLVDGMRPDSLAGVEKAQEFLGESLYTLSARTVMPSVTLPCHMSLFHSVEPGRHGITDNVYTPQVRPVKGLFEVLKEHGKTSAFYYNWEQLRDVWRPGSVTYSRYEDGGMIGWLDSDRGDADETIARLKATAPDFIFYYIAAPDEIGHKYGWMGPEYLGAVASSWDCIRRVADAAGEAYDCIILADHGGHQQMHGTDCPEDMTIPVILHGKSFRPGKLARPVSIMDVAPTAAKLLGVPQDADWVGSSLL